MNGRWSRRKFLLLSLTWGLPTTLAGCLVAAVLRLTGHRPERYGYCRCFSLGKRWGGCCIGQTILRDTVSSTRLTDHEHGHAIQNCYFGPFMPLLVSMPSSTRFWVRRVLEKTRFAAKLKPYDSAWFEGQATRLGAELHAFLKDMQ